MSPWAKVDAAGEKLRELERELSWTKKGVPLCPCQLAGRTRTEYTADLERRVEAARAEWAGCLGAIRRDD